MAAGLLMLFTVQAQGQEHPYIDGFTLQEMTSGVMIDWNIRGGNTCEGMDVERSLDSLHFEAVHRFEGICGNVDRPMPYRFFDPDPPGFRKIHYRIKLGSVGYSSVKGLFVQQLKESDHRFYPNPVRKEATLLLYTVTGTVDLRIFDARGSLVRTFNTRTGPELKLDLADLPSGIYLYEAFDPTQRVRGRFIKE